MERALSHEVSNAHGSAEVTFKAVLEPANMVGLCLDYGNGYTEIW